MGSLAKRAKRTLWNQKMGVAAERLPKDFQKLKASKISRRDRVNAWLKKAKEKLVQERQNRV